MRLSNLIEHPCSNLDLEQYSISGDLAARWISDIISFGDLYDGCSVTDMGAGNGILGIGCLLMGAKEAIFIESDSEACDILTKNLTSESLIGSSKVINEHIKSTNLSTMNTDVIITNPPWGRQLAKADRPFFESIIASGKTAHILHNSKSTHIPKLFESQGWSCEKYGQSDFALPGKYAHHIRQRDKTSAGFWRVSNN